MKLNGKRIRGKPAFEYGPPHVLSREEQLWGSIKCLVWSGLVLWFADWKVKVSILKMNYELSWIVFHVLCFYVSYFCTGDRAIGEGVTRHVLGTVMEMLQSGFSLDERGTVAWIGWGGIDCIMCILVVRLKVHVSTLNHGTITTIGLLQNLNVYVSKVFIMAALA